MKKIIIISVSLLAFSASTTKSFTFDLWKSGDKKNEIIEKSKKNGIWLHDGGRTYIGSDFVLANKLEYQTNIFNEKADVYLYFTNKTNILYMVQITWDEIKNTNKAHDLYATMRILLDDKYNEQEESNGKYNGYFRNGKEYQGCQYTLKKYKKENIELRLNKCDNSIIAKYQDDFIENKNREEEKQTNYKKRKDERKF